MFAHLSKLLSTKSHRTSKSKPARPNSFRPTAEALEDRVVLTTIFRPVYGAETITWQPGNAAGMKAGSAATSPISYNPDAVQQPQVYLIFWGASWNSTNAGKRAQDVDAIINRSNYLSGLQQYGSSGQAVFNQSTDWTIDNSSAGTPTWSNCDAEIQKVLDHQRTDWVKPPDVTYSQDPLALTRAPIYVVVWDNGGDAGGQNGFTRYSTPLHPTYTDPTGALAGGVLGNAIQLHNGSNEGTFTWVFSHELVERISTGTGHGITMNAPRDAGTDGEWQNAQIADNEPDGTYFARLNVKDPFPWEVQAYWSIADQAFVVPDGTTTHWTRMAAGAVLQTVSALNANGVQEMFGIGTDPNHAVYYQIQHGPNGAWDNAWGTLAGGAKQLAVGKEANGLLTVFIIGGDNQVYSINEVSPGNWSGAQWQSLGGYATALAVGQDSSRELEVFAVGSDNAVRYRNETGMNTRLYNAWGLLGGSAKPQTAFASQKTLIAGNEADGRMVLYAIWNDSAQSVHYLDQVKPAFGAPTWSGAIWQSMGGGAKDLAAGRVASGAETLFIVGMNNQLYSQWETGANGAWTGWHAVGRGFVTQIAVGQTAAGSLEVFGIGTDNAVYGIVPTNSSSDSTLNWTRWGAYAYGLSLGTNQDGTFTLFEIGSDKDVYAAKVN
jgi:hypothetical protein